MKRLALSIAAVLSTVLLAAGPAIAAKVKKGNANSGWIFDQNSDEGGRGETVISPKGVRIKLKTLVAVLEAPKYDATIFDTSSKKYFFMPYDVWTKKYETKRRIPSVDTGMTAKVAGMDTRCYRSRSKSIKDVWFTTDVPISNDMSTFICNILNVPGGHGMPLRMEVTKSRGAKVKMFDTLKITSAKIDPKQFRLPDGYKKVTSELQLFVKDDKMQEMSNFLQ